MNAPTQGNGSSVVVQGRLIWTLGQDIVAGKVKTDMRTKQVIIDQKTGQPVVEYGFGLAIPKMDPRTGQQTEDFKKIWAALHTEAFTLFPSGQIPPTFAMKYKDGDTAVDDAGQPYSKREGYAGHFVVSCTTRLPIKYFKWEGGQNILINTGIKCGDYVNAQLNIVAHPAVGQSKAGLYVNPSAVQFIQAGKEIINAPSGDQLFGQAMPSYAGQVEAPVYGAMPGQSTTPPPVTPNPHAPNPGHNTYNQAPPPQQQQYGQQNPAMPGMTPPPAQTYDPYHNVLPPQHQPQNMTPPPQQQQYGQQNPAMPQMPGMPR